jgi:flagellar basal body P-ring formation protein FlgA
MPPIFRRLALGALLAAAASPAAALSGFENIDALERRLAAQLGADIGESGGPARPIDRRLRLAACPAPAAIDAPALGAVAIRCEATGWRIRVPLAPGGAAAPRAAAAAAARSAPVVRRGDLVEVVAMTASFTVSTAGIAEQDGAPGERIRVRPERRGAPPMIGEVLPDGRIALPGFN